ncbi:MAG: nitrogen regulatory protein 2 [Clostridia bacterium]|jgi:nitrogen regulatory protein P-II 1|nr:nitrogen regulatory protein 2 [Clostridia bacterium]MDN5321697.1 nitrogen regulatory protein 2 [Clostridia bacterium]
MKKIEAIIRPNKLEEVKNALDEFGVNGLTITQVIGCGLQKGHTGVYRGQEMSINLLPKIKLEVVVKADMLEDVIKVINTAAKTGQVGDGKIFVYDVVGAVRIRTDERGTDAIS